MDSARGRESSNNRRQGGQRRVNVADEASQKHGRRDPERDNGSLTAAQRPAAREGGNSARKKELSSQGPSKRQSSTALKEGTSTGKTTVTRSRETQQQRGSGANVRKSGSTMALAHSGSQILVNGGGARLA